MKCDEEMIVFMFWWLEVDKGVLDMWIAVGWVVFLIILLSSCHCRSQ